MKTNDWRIIAATLFVAFTLNCFAQTNQQETAKISFSVTKLMSHDDFVKTGLTKLNGDEIKALNEWLQNYTQSIPKTNAVIVAVTNEPAAVKQIVVFSQRVEESVIETAIDGDFEGWDGETIWKMENGQIWQQASYAYHYHYSSDPKVLIYRADGGWKMKVEDDDESVAVKRLK
jgi:hypothetical protein